MNADAMRDSFDYDTYWWIIERLSRTNRPLRFADLASGFPAAPFFILRHDVDYSPAAALDLADQEARRGVRSTYFLLLNGLYYNMLSPEHGTFGRRLAAMGHEIGLHYDVKFLEAFPRQKWRDLIRTQATLLGKLSGTRVTAIAMHQPGLNGEDPMRHTGQYMNAYDDRFCRDIPYFSDSCRAWWNPAWEMLTSGDTTTRFQLAIYLAPSNRRAMNCCGGSPNIPGYCSTRPEGQSADAERLRYRVRCSSIALGSGPTRSAASFAATRPCLIGGVSPAIARIRRRGAVPNEGYRGFGRPGTRQDRLHG